MSKLLQTQLPLAQNEDKLMTKKKIRLSLMMVVLFGTQLLVFYRSIQVINGLI